LLLLLLLILLFSVKGLLVFPTELEWFHASGFLTAKSSSKRDFFVVVVVIVLVVLVLTFSNRLLVFFATKSSFKVFKAVGRC